MFGVAYKHKVHYELSSDERLNRSARFWDTVHRRKKGTRKEIFPQIFDRIFPERSHQNNNCYSLAKETSLIANAMFCGEPCQFSNMPKEDGEQCLGIMAASRPGYASE